MSQCLTFPQIRVFMDIVQLLLILTRPYSSTFLDAVCRLIFGAKQELPPIEDKILLTSATELARKIRKKQVNLICSSILMQDFFLNCKLNNGNLV